MNTQILARAMLDCVLERITAVYEMIKRLISPMPNWARFGLVLALLLPANLAVQAADFYVAQVATGTGGSATTATNVAWFNTASNWRGGAGTIQPGDVIHLVGTISNTLAIGGSGNPGAPITIYFETNAQLSAPTWPSGSMIFSIYSQSNIVVDGGSNGIIQATDNGTSVASGGNKDYQNKLTGLYLYGVQNVMVKNLCISNMYCRQTNTDNCGQIGACVYWYGSGITISNCILTGASDACSGLYLPGGTSNFLITACILTNFNHGVTLGVGPVNGNPLFNNFAVTHNRIFSGDMWETADGIGDLGLHRDPVFFFNESGSQGYNGGHYTGYISNLVVACNCIVAGYHPLSHNAGTSAMFFDLYNNANAVHVRVYNNISICTYPLAYGDANIGASGTDVLFANNTAVGWPTNSGYGGGTSFAIGGTNAYSFNNLSISQGGSYYLTESITSGLTVNNATCSQLLSGVHSGYNVFNGVTGYSGWISVIFAADNGGTFSESFYDTLSQCENMFGGSISSQIEINSTNATASLGVDYVPLANDTVCGGMGTNLTAWGIVDDCAGNPRPSSGPWTIGAYQIGAVQVVGTNIPPAGGSTNLVVTPTNLNFGMVAVGATTSQTIVITNTGSSAISGSASVAAPFTIVSGGTYSLTAGQSQPIVVGYDPVAAGTNIQSLTFSNGPSVALSGTAVAPPAVSAITQNGADVDLTAPGLQIFAGSVVQYSATASDPNGLPLTWQWSYSVNGGPQTVVQSGTGTVGSVSYNYTASTAGNTYVWTLQADNGYATTTSTLTVGIEAPPPATNGLSFSASAAALTTPFVLTNDSFSQPVQTVDPTQGGQAVFTFTVTNSASYIIQASVNAPGDANNSFFINMDAQPVAPTMIWDIPLTSGFEQRIVSWRGAGTDTNNQYVPKVFSLSAGTHQLIIRGREAGVQLQSISLLNYLSPPTNLHVASQ